MTTTLTRRVVASVAATGAAAAIVAGVTTTANAAPGDPVTGGTTTISIPAANAYAAAKGGFVINAIKPATSAYAPDTNTLDLSLPVSGGDGSGKAGIGSITHDGGIIVANVTRNRVASLTNITFSLEDYELRTQPAGTTAPIELARLAGDQFFTAGPNGQQTVRSTNLTLLAAGASYLDKSLNTTVFKAGQSIGSFTTTFTNAQY